MPINVSFEIYIKKCCNKSQKKNVNNLLLEKKTKKRRRKLIHNQVPSRCVNNMIIYIHSINQGTREKPHKNLATI